MNDFSPQRPLRIGTRQSPLALWQATAVRRLLSAHVPEESLQLVPMVSTGDQVTGPLHEHGGKGLFVKELDVALLAGEIDIAVHSLKDVPGQLVQGLVLAACMERGLPYDVLIHRDLDVCVDFAGLPAGSRVGTSAPRRAMQVRALRDDLEILPIRGNVATRLGKLSAGEYDAVIMAEAGLDRLGMLPPHAKRVSLDTMLPAVGQAVVTVAVHEDKVKLQELVRTACHHEITGIAVAAERALLETIAGDCHTPLAGYATVDDEQQVTLQAFYASPDGASCCRHQMQASVSVAEELGQNMAEHVCATIV